MIKVSPGTWQMKWKAKVNEGGGDHNCPAVDVIGEVIPAKAGTQ